MSKDKKKNPILELCNVGKKYNISQPNEVEALKDISPFQYNGKGKLLKLGDIHFESGFYVKRAMKMIQKRLDAATHRVDLFTRYGYDTKFASNLIQLLMEGIELMNTGKICMPLSYADKIVEIKQGEYTPQQIEEWSNDLLIEGDKAFEKTSLPENPDINRIESFVIQQIKDWLNDK